MPRYFIQTIQSSLIQFVIPSLKGWKSVSDFVVKAGYCKKGLTRKGRNKSSWILNQIVLGIEESLFKAATFPVESSQTTISKVNQVKLVQKCKTLCIRYLFSSRASLVLSGFRLNLGKSSEIINFVSLLNTSRGVNFVNVFRARFL